MVNRSRLSSGRSEDGLNGGGGPHHDGKSNRTAIGNRRAIGGTAVAWAKSGGSVSNEPNRNPRQRPRQSASMWTLAKMSLSAWNNDYASATLPVLGVAGGTPSEIVLVRADGQPASSVKVELIPAPPQSGG